MRMTIAALKSGRYRLTDELRQEMVERAATDMRNGPTVRDRMLAVRMLAVLDTVDVHRERNTVAEKQGETSAVLQLLRARAAADPAVRALLADLTEAMIRSDALPTEGAPAALPAPDGDASAPG
jgi:hypothetical protein